MTLYHKPFDVHVARHEIFSADCVVLIGKGVLKVLKATEGTLTVRQLYFWDNLFALIRRLLRGN